jgi:hypothetical protein
MTENELLKEVLQGVLLIVGEYRGSYAEMAGYISKIANQTAIAGYAEEEMKYESDQLKIGFHEVIART